MSDTVRLMSAPESDSYRAEVRAFIAATAPKVRARAGFRSPADSAEDAMWRRWRADLYAAGHLGVDWPPEFGGRGLHQPDRELILAEELAAHRLPPLNDQTMLAAFALLAFGTVQQKEGFLPRIRDGIDVWCQLFSEPNAGSDLGALQTAARREGESWVIDGQKVWSSNAQWAHHGFLLARTGTTAERHRGITAFIVDMTAPGVETRALREITGTVDFNEVFLAGVRVDDSMVLGPVGGGWTVAMESLGAERSGIGAGAARLRRLIADLVRMLTVDGPPGSTTIDDGAARRELGRLAAAVEALNQLVRERLVRELEGASRPIDVPLGKLLFSELNLAIAELGVRLQGIRGLLVEGDEDAVDDGRWQDEFLYARTYTIAGGSSEIMRNVIAERVLGMPREARPS